MAAASLAVGTIGRGIQFANLSAVIVSVTATATVYTAATGGLPIDLTTILQQVAPASGLAPNYTQAINPADIVGVLPLQVSTNGYTPGGLVVGTPTYTAVPWMSTTNASAVPGILATCPATLRLTNGTAQVADGAVTDAVTFLLLVMRNGANN